MKAIRAVDFSMTLIRKLEDEVGEAREKEGAATLVSMST